VALVYRYFDTIPSPQLYRLLITITPADRRYYPWIKSKKKTAYNKELLGFVMKKFECSPKESREYVDMLLMTEEGKEELFDVCRGYGLTEKEVDTLMKAGDNE